MSGRQRFLNAMPLLMLAGVCLIFAAQTSKFLEPRNLLNIVAQASSTGILTIGMTFVLLTAGVDLSVGAMMFVAAAIAGKMAVSGTPLPLVLLTVPAVTLVFATFNGIFVVRVRVAAFIVTLAALFIGRGLGLLITKTRAINLPDSFLTLGSAQIVGIPLPAWIFFAASIIGHVVLTRTPFGRQIFAVGHNLEAAGKAGIQTGRILFTVYIISGLCAAVAAMITLSQLGAVSPKFGEQREFAAIAAAVLGGASLFGGRGNILPGAVVGSLLIQTVENGMVLINANPYVYPMAISSVIFLAIILESLRNRAKAATPKLSRA
jgi:ribose transport system permease protein